MNAGKLDRKIKLQSPTVARDSWGGATTTWTTFATVFASADFTLGESLQQLYFNQSSRINLKDSLVFTIRYRTDIQAETRIVYNSANYRIEGIREFGGRKEFLQIIAAKIRND